MTAEETLSVDGHHVVEHERAIELGSLMDPHRLGTAFSLALSEGTSGLDRADAVAVLLSWLVVSTLGTDARHCEANAADDVCTCREIEALHIDVSELSMVRARHSGNDVPGDSVLDDDYIRVPNEIYLGLAGIRHVPLRLAIVTLEQFVGESPSPDRGGAARLRALIGVLRVSLAPQSYNWPGLSVGEVRPRIRELVAHLAGVVPLDGVGAAGLLHDMAPGLADIVVRALAVAHLDWSAEEYDAPDTFGFHALLKCTEPELDGRMLERFLAEPAVPSGPLFAVDEVADLPAILANLTPEPAVATRGRPGGRIRMMGFDLGETLAVLVAGWSFEADLATALRMYDVTERWAGTLGAHLACVPQPNEVVVGLCLGWADSEGPGQVTGDFDVVRSAVLDAPTMLHRLVHELTGLLPTDRRKNLTRPAQLNLVPAGALSSARLVYGEKVRNPSAYDTDDGDFDDSEQYQSTHFGRHSGKDRHQEPQLDAIVGFSLAGAAGWCQVLDLTPEVQENAARQIGDRLTDPRLWLIASYD